MEWKNLSNGAKSILEWLNGPYTERKHTLVIKRNERFVIGKQVDILVTDELYNEIKQYCLQTFDDDFDRMLVDENKEENELSIRLA